MFFCLLLVVYTHKSMKHMYVISHNSNSMVIESEIQFRNKRTTGRNNYAHALYVDDALCVCPCVCVRVEIRSIISHLFVNLFTATGSSLQSLRIVFELMFGRPFSIPDQKSPPLRPPNQVIAGGFPMCAEEGARASRTLYSTERLSCQSYTVSLWQ